MVLLYTSRAFTRTAHECICLWRTSKSSNIVQSLVIIKLALARLCKVQLLVLRINKDMVDIFIVSFRRWLLGNRIRVRFRIRVVSQTLIVVRRCVDPLYLLINWGSGFSIIMVDLLLLLLLLLYDWLLNNWYRNKTRRLMNMIRPLLLRLIDVHHTGLRRNKIVPIRCSHNNIIWLLLLLLLLVLILHVMVLI